MMMENIRTAASHIVVKIIFAIIIVAFIFTGMGSFFLGSSGQDDQRFIAKVDGEGISRANFENQVQQTVQRMGNSGSAELTQMVRSMVFNQQVNTQLFYNLTEKLGVRISDEQVKDAIRHQDTFFENGRFSNQRYLELLAANNLTPDSYAELIRGSLQQEQAMQSISYSDFVLPYEKSTISLQNQVRVVDVASIPFKTLFANHSASVNDQQVETYYQQNLAAFTKPERVKIDYIRIDRNRIAQQPDIANISDKALQDYYQKNLTHYEKPVKHAYSVIELDDKKVADDLYQQIQGGADFAALAKDKSLYPIQRKNAGSLGWFTMNDPALPSLIANAKLTTKNQVTLVSEDGHFFIVKLDDIDGAKYIDFALVKDEIRATLQEQKVAEGFSEAVGRLEQALTSGAKSIDELASAAKLTDFTEHSDWSYYNDNTAVTRITTIRDVIFDGTMFNGNGSTKKMSDIVTASDDDDSVYVLQVADYLPEGPSPLALEKKGIADLLISQEVTKLLTEKSSEILAALNSGKTVDGVDFSQHFNLTRQSTELSKEIVEQIFNIVPSVDNKKVYGANIGREQNLLVFALTQIEQSPRQDELKSVDNLRLEKIKNDDYSLMDALRSQAKIEVMANANL